MNQDDVTKARRDFEAWTPKISKAWYEQGNGPERTYSVTYDRYASVSNVVGEGPCVISLKKKYR